MKSKLVKELKEMGYRRVNGKKVESYSFYFLCGIWTELFRDKNLK